MNNNDDDDDDGDRRTTYLASTRKEQKQQSKRKDIMLLQQITQCNPLYSHLSLSLTHTHTHHTHPYTMCYSRLLGEGGLAVKAEELEQLHTEFEAAVASSLRNGLELYDFPAVIHSIAPGWAKVTDACGEALLIGHQNTLNN